MGPSSRRRARSSLEADAEPRKAAARTGQLRDVVELALGVPEPGDGRSLIPVDVAPASACAAGAEDPHENEERKGGGDAECAAQHDENVDRRDPRAQCEPGDGP